MLRFDRGGIAVCEQSIPREKYAQIKGRMAAREREVTDRMREVGMHHDRALVVAPGVPIADQLDADFNPSNAGMFYQKCQVLTDGPYPEPVAIRGTTTNRADLDEAHVVITNIHQLQGEANRWLQALPADYFDLILFDEGHHSVADSWQTLKAHFPGARIVNFSATPLRADGQIMAGRVLFSYPIFRAIQEGYVKRLKAVQLNPRTLRYVRREGAQEIEVGLAEVRRLGETDADFRRSIVTSVETLNTIVDASIRELDRLRAETGETRLKIIASALNFEHCRQIVEAYTARGRRTGYVHSRELAPARDHDRPQYYKAEGLTEPDTNSGSREQRLNQPEGNSCRNFLNVR
jgi:superfamily II DNA or RNA helicase